MPNGKLPNGSGSGSGSAQIKLGKAARRRQKKKAEKLAGAGTGQEEPANNADTAAAGPSAAAQVNGSAATTAAETAQEGASSSTSASASASAFTLEAPSGEAEADAELLKHFGSVFQHFARAESSAQASGEAASDAAAAAADENGGKGQVIYSDAEDESDSDATDDEGRKGKKAVLSKKKQKRLQRLTVAELKQLAPKPDVVEWTDVTAADPRLLIAMKSTRNTVPVPAHWSLKRAYLDGKRGIEKPAFQLPSYIADTGIATVKDALREKEQDQTLKASTRQRVQPKMGKVDIDYQKLHDAFFKFQRAPASLTRYGDAYYEAKELEVRHKERRPGELSDALKEALSIPPLAPPPYLLAQQRYGPPPSYPYLPIAGLNAPIPPGAQWGFAPGAWGRPPLDEFGRPLFGGDPLGDGSGLSHGLPDHAAYEAQVDREERWGELEPEESEEEEEEDEEEEEGQGQGEQEGEEMEEEEQDGAEEGQGRQQAPFDGMQTPSGLATPSGMQSVASTMAHGLETPQFIELRKDARVGGPSSHSQQHGHPPPPPPTAPPSGPPKQLYQVLPESNTAIQGLMGSERGYDVYGAAAAAGQAAAPVLGAEDQGRKVSAHVIGAASRYGDSLALQLGVTRLLTPTFPTSSIASIRHLRSTLTLTLPTHTHTLAKNPAAQIALRQRLRGGAGPGGARGAERGRGRAAVRAGRRRRTAAAFRGKRDGERCEPRGDEPPARGAGAQEAAEGGAQTRGTRPRCPRGQGAV